MNDSVSNLKTIAPNSRWTARFEPVARRVGHGGSAWATNSRLVQPQDGSSDGRDTPSRITDISTRLQLGAVDGPALMEPEDARFTGGTRSLVRRLLGLNITPRTISAPTAKGRPAKKVTGAAAGVRVA
jgi:hypothetical protein